MSLIATVCMAAGIEWKSLRGPVNRRYEETLASARRLTETPPGAPLPSLLLITVDTLRADHLGIYGYSRPTTPNIDAWFANGQIFEAAYSTEASTTPSVVSMLTGMLPQNHGVRLFFQRLPSEVLTVADFLRKAGYQCAAVVSNMVLTAEAVGLDTRFDYYDDLVAEREPYRRDVYERRASLTTDAALHWLTKSRDPRRPFLLWVHYIDPHGPYAPPADSPVQFSHPTPLPVDISRIPDYQRHPGISDGREYVDLYDEEIAYADREIGRLLRAFERNAGSDYLTIFAADHGETMMEHEQWFSHGYQVYDEIVRVPLLVRGSMSRSQRISIPVSLADVTPTFLEFAGIQPPAGVYGRPLSRRNSGRPIFSEATDQIHEWRAMLIGRKKWMAEIKAPNDTVSELVATLIGWNRVIRPAIVSQRFYDLQSDPHETRWRSWPSGRQPEPLLQAILSDPDPAGIGSPLERRIHKGRGPVAPKVNPGVDRKTLNRLRSLGYVK